MDALNSSTTLKSKYGDTFFINHLRSRGAPLTARNSNQLSGILDELLNYIRNKNDATNNEIVSYIDQLSYLRNDNDRAEAFELLEYLGLNGDVPPTTQVQTENIEKVAYLKGIPKDSECPICLENIDGNGYTTEKCRNFFHKKCLDAHCFRKRDCPCPICRRTIKFINKKGGGKEELKKINNRLEKEEKLIKM